MVRPNHHHYISQPASFQQNYLPNHTRSIPQGLYHPRGPRPTQPRNAANRNNNQNGAPTHIVGISSEPGNAGQSSIIFSSHHANVNISRTPNYVSGQVASNIRPNYNANPQQAPMYPVNNQIPQMPFPPQTGAPPPQTQQYFSGYPPHMILPTNIIPFSPGPLHTQMQPYCFTASSQPPFPNNTPVNSNHSNPSSATVISKGNDLAPQVNYPRHNVSPPNVLPSNTYQKIKTRPKALTDIVDPATGKNIAEDIYGNAAASTSVSQEKPEKPCVIKITHPYPSQQHQQIRQTSKLVVSTNTSTVLAGPNQSSIITPISSKSPSPVPVSASSRSNSPIISATVINSIPIFQSIVVNRAEKIINKSDKGDCNEVPVTVNGSYHNNDHPLTPVVEERCSQPQFEAVSYGQQCRQENKSEEIKKEPTEIEEKIVDEKIIEIVAPVKIEVHQKRTHGKATQKKRNKKKFKGRDINRNQTQNESTSSEDSIASSATQSLKQENVEENEDSMASTKVKKANREAAEDLQPFICNQFTLKNLEVLIDDYNDNEVKIKIESKMEHEQQDQIQFVLPKAVASSSSELEVKKEELTFEVLSFEGLLKSDDENTKEEFFSKKLTITMENNNHLILKEKIDEVGNAFVKIVNDPINIEISSNLTAQNDTELFNSIRGSSEIDFFVDDMSDEDQQQQPVKNEPKEQKQSKSQSEEDLQQFDSKVETEPQQNANEIEEQQQLSDNEVEIEYQQSNNECQLSDNKVKEEYQQSNNKVVEEYQKMNNECQLSDNKVEEQYQQIDNKDKKEQNDNEVKKDQKQTDDNKPEEKAEKEVKEKKEREFIKPPVHKEINSHEKSPKSSSQSSSKRKIYDREFLWEMRDNPECKVRPDELDKFIEIIKCPAKPSSRNLSSIQFFQGKEHERLFPNFSKPSFNAKLPSSRRSFQGKAKPNKPNVIHVSLSLNENIKLRKTENAWKPSCLKKVNTSEEEAKTQALYKQVRSVLNKLTPQKFHTLVNQVKELEIDTEERFHGVINLVFQKAVDEPAFSVAYASMCQSLSSKKVTESNNKNSSNGPDQDNNDFRRLLIHCCQTEFEKNTRDENVQKLKVKEIEECEEPEKKKELELRLEEENRRIKRKYLGNVKFVGELYKKEMLHSRIMCKCIDHLLQNTDEENLECLCKLLTTIGKIFENVRKEYLAKSFETLEELIRKDKKKKISSRIRFMIQDVIDLWKNQWVPRRNENNPKTMDQIQKEVETERIINDTPVNRTPLNTVRKDERNNSDRRRSRAGSSSSNDGWSSVPTTTKSKQTSSIDMTKLNFKTPAAEETRFGSRNMFMFHQPVDKKSSCTPNKFALLDMPFENNSRRPSFSSSISQSSTDHLKPDYKSPWNDGRSRLRNEDQRMSLGPTSARESSRYDNQRMSLGPTSARENSRYENQRISLDPTSARENSQYDENQQISSGSISIQKSLRRDGPFVHPSSSSIKSFKTSSTPPPVTVNNDSKKPPKDENELRDIVKSLLNSCSLNNMGTFITDAMETIQDNFDKQSYPLLVEEAVNSLLERKSIERQRFSALLAHMIKNKIISLSLVQTELEKVLKIADDLVIDIPQFWKYFAEILSEMIAADAHPISELKRTLAILKSIGKCSILLGELLSKLVEGKGPKWVVDNWNQSGLEWNELVDPDCEKIDDILERYKLEFLVRGLNNNNTEKLSENKTMKQIHEHLLKLLRENNIAKTNDIENIKSWISSNVGEQSKQSQFANCLVTAILETSIEPVQDTSRLKAETLTSLLPLIETYTENQRKSQLQCLYAIQSYTYSLSYPQGVLLKIIELLYDKNILPESVFLDWEKTKNPAEGHGVAIMSLTSFFDNLREADDSNESMSSVLP